MREGQLHQAADRVGDAGGDHVVLRLVLLQHPPHGVDVVAGEAPVAARVEVAQGERVGHAQLDAGHAVGDLARDELQAAPRRLVVEEDPRAGEEVVRLAVVDRDEVAVDLGHSVGAARVEGRALVLRRLEHAAEHLAGRGLVEADGRVDLPDRLQHAGDPHGGELGGQHRLGPRGGHERLRRQVVDLVRLGLLQRRREGRLVEQVGLHEPEVIAHVVDALVRLGGRAAHHSPHVVALCQEQLGQVRAVLPGDAGDQRAGHVVLSPPPGSPARATRRACRPASCRSGSRASSPCPPGAAPGNHRGRAARPRAAARRPR